eukprot:Skav217710  [mRNA]  locus=scaffold2294:173975:177955:- [translate_table: standard]
MPVAHLSLLDRSRGWEAVRLRVVTTFANELQDQLMSGQILRSSQVSPDPVSCQKPGVDFEPEKLQFSEFLILNCREALHRKLDCMWPKDEEPEERAQASALQKGLAIKCNPRGEGTVPCGHGWGTGVGLGYVPLTKAMLDIYLDVIGSPIPRAPRQQSGAAILMSRAIYGLSAAIFMDSHGG